jgi:5'(3')-deoxyribonucleotidase
MTAILDASLGYDTLDVMVDVDDVVVPWYETIDSHLLEAWGPRIHDARPWSMWEDWPGRTREEWEDIVVHATMSGLYTNTDPFPGAVEAINRLRWYGHRVHIVTARGFMANGGNIRRWTGEYLATYGIGHDTLTFAKDKAQAMRELGVHFDWAIDDGVHNFEVLTDAEVNVWLHDAPHNRGYETDFRISSLWEFSNKVLATTKYAQAKPMPA